MTLTIDPNWWKTLFDEIYLVTDARSVCNDEITQQEVAVIRRLVPLRQNHLILDLCGGHGRHSIELCRCKYTHCTVCDYSLPLLQLGMENADHRSCHPQFVQCDARGLPMDAGTFDHVFILGNSLGYTPDGESDLVIIRESLRVLKAGGWILIDVAERNAALRDLSTRTWHEIGTDVVVCRQREIFSDRVSAREVVLSKKKGMIRDRNYCIRLYNPEKLANMLAQAGFYNVRVHKDFYASRTEGERGCMDHRIILTAQKSQ